MVQEVVVAQKGLALVAAAAMQVASFAEVSQACHPLDSSLSPA